MTPEEFFSALRAYRAYFHASVTSFGRTKQRNADVGGVTYSAHLFDLAADVVYDREPGAEERRAIGRGLGLIVVIEDDHDHLEPLDYSP